MLTTATPNEHYNAHGSSLLILGQHRGRPAVPSPVRSPSPRDQAMAL
jgi:hypothetical protein